MPDNETALTAEESGTSAVQAPNKSNKERLKEITDSIETGIRDLFETERFQSYLSVMSRFHKYSVNNTMLIYLQKPDATLVAGFNKWRDQFGRHVKKGEKAIQIIAPTPFLKKTQEPVLDPDTQAPMLDADGNAMYEEKTVKIPMFKPVSVFDVSQTEGRPLPQLASALNGDVEHYDAFLEALRRSAPVPIEFENMAPGTDGYFSVEGQRIAIREGMSQVQTISAVIHEIAHSELHNYSQIEVHAIESGLEPPKKKDRRTEEVEAESISYSICQYYGIETGENSFGYIASWSKGKELKELRTSLETINQTASSLITAIDQHFAEVCKERGIEQKQEPEMSEANSELGDAEVLLLLDSDQYLHVQRVDDHYDYSLYGKETKKLLDGGQFPRESTKCHTDKTEMGNAIREACVRQGLEPKRTTLVPLEWLENLQKANMIQEPEQPLAPATAKGNDAQRELPTRDPADQPPDAIIDPMALEHFGYTDDGMFPVSKDRAMELFERDVPVYLIYRNNTEAMAFEPEDILDHDGLFGITKEDWEALKADIPCRDIEKRFSDSPHDAFLIYHLNDSAHRYMFRAYDELDTPPSPERYHPVYIGPLTETGSDGKKLEGLFQTFNLTRPADYTFHSMSAGDIVALKQNGVVSYHYCDSVGFQELPDFAKPENYLRNAEMSVEDDYGMIDGIINNGPKQPSVAELEADVKAGKSISLLDLANAVKAEQREKKASVLDKLKRPVGEPQRTQKTERRRNGAEREI